MTIDRYLEDLERRIDVETEEELLREWLEFTQGRFRGQVFSPRRGARSAARLEWPQVRVNEAVDDFDKMALQQFGMCSRILADGGGEVLAVRANYGTGILPSLFGAAVFRMDDETNTLPTTRPFEDVRRIEQALDAGLPELHPASRWLRGGFARSLGGRALEMAERYAVILRHYPRIAKYVHVYHPDLQGPIDVCELLWGSRLFLDLVDRPDLVKAMLQLVTETYTRFLREWLRIICTGAKPLREDLPLSAQGVEAHWGLLHKGHIMLRDDSAMNLAPAMFDEFIRPYDQLLLDEFGGGAIHFCGRGDHFIASMSQMTGLYAIHLSQPELNDMETIYRHTVDRGIKLLGLGRKAAEAALAAGRDLRGQVHCA